MEKSNFQTWLHSIGKTFRSLSCEQRNQTLDYLIDSSGSSQLFHLSEHLSGLLKRDFLRLLPKELAFHVLSYLDVESLLSCCQVSSAWEEVTNSCVCVWRRVCTESGVAADQNAIDALYYKHRYLQASLRLSSLKEGGGFESQVLYGHTDRIMAIYYRDGKIATGSDDHTVRLWDCHTGLCIKVLRTHTVADVKFDATRLLTASFDTTSACWDLESGHMTMEYTGHVAAVFSIDYSPDLDLLVTGSADSTVKVWTLGSGTLLRTLPQHRSAWITQVRLHWVPSSGHYSILSRDNVSIHLWQLQCGSHQIVVMDEWQNPYNDLMAGVHIKDDRALFASLDTFNHCFVVEHALGELEAPAKQRHSACLHRDSYAQAFLGSGTQYDVILTDGDCPTVEIIRHGGHCILSSVHIPADYRQSKRASTFTLGEQGWLDGFDGQNDQGIFFAACLRDNSLYVLKWRALDGVVPPRDPIGEGKP